MMKATVACILVSYALAATFDTYPSRVGLGSQVTVGTKVVGTKAKFLIEKTGAGHVAFGVGTGMSSGDIVAIERSASGVTLRDCKLVGKVMPACSESIENWEFADTATPTNSYEVTATSMKVEFTRNLTQSGTDGDMKIETGDNSFIWSYNNQNSLGKHDATGGKGVTKFDLSKSSAVSSFGMIVNCLIGLASSVFVMFLN